MHKQTAQKISDWIKNYSDTAGTRSLVVGISGGIDSALVSTLCAMTGLPTYLITMPIHQEVSQVSRAQLHMKWLQEQSETMGSNVKCREIQLTHLYDKFENVFDSVSAREFQNELGFANSRARLRMTTLYQVATACNGIVVGTGNKVEDFGVGFYTKYGDGGVDISPIADLTKTEVREMASALGIISEILNAKPTDGLWGDDRSDEDQLGATYPELEWAMQYVASGNTDQTHLSERELQVLHIYNNLHRKNLHKMIPIPVFNND